MELTEFRERVAAQLHEIYESDQRDIERDLCMNCRYIRDAFKHPRFFVFGKAFPWFLKTYKPRLTTHYAFSISFGGWVPLCDKCGYVGHDWLMYGHCSVCRGVANAA